MRLLVPHGSLIPLALLVSLAAAGCSADLEALYADEQALITLLPARPDDEAAAACGMCALQQCEKQRLECEQDALCERLLSCKAPCDNPACLFECEADHAARGKHNNFHTCLVETACTSDPDCPSECDAEHRASEAFDAYRVCVFEKKCRDECATGENWQCLDDYSWTRPDDGHAPPRRLTIMVRDIDLSDSAYPGAEGVNVNAWLSSDNFVNRVQVVSNNLGIAKFADLPLNDDNAFRGYLYFFRDISADDGIGQIHDIGRPIHRELTMEEVVMPKSRYLEEIGDLLSVAPNPGNGHVRARVYDCLNAPAPGISFSLPSGQGRTVFYSHSSFETPGTETNETGMGGFVNVGVSPGGSSVMIRAARSSDKVLVSEHEIHVFPDTLTRVDLYPLARTKDPSAR